MRRIFLLSILFIGTFCFVQNTWAQNYEVLFDSATSTVVKIYSEAGDGTVGMGNNHSWTDWDISHDALIGDYASYNDLIAIIGIKNWSWGIETPQIYRSFFLFNTSIVQESTIISVKLNMYVKTIQNTDDDGDDFINIVQTSQASNYILERSDYSKCGQTHNPIEGASRIDISSLVNNSYNTWNFNISGLSWISKNGLTKIGLREGHDILDNSLDFPSPNFGTNRIDVSTIEEPDLNKKPYLLIHYKKQKQINPVIVVPGIAGSWYSSKDGWLMDPILHTYDDLLSSLHAAGYKGESTLFSMPYNWRQDNTFSAYELGQLVDRAMSLNDGNRVDIVAHSMGGLVARKYLSDPDNLQHVNNLIFLGTPHQGAPKAYPIWEAGEGFNSLSDKTLRSIIKFEAESSGESLLEYIRNGIVSLHQLLPSYEYLRDSDGWRDYNPVSSPNNYPYNNWLTNLNDNNNLIALNNSEINIYNLRGDVSGTVTLYEVGDIDLNREEWPHGEVITAYKGAGDGTVPVVSSNLFTSTLVPNASHRLIPTEAREQVIEILTGTATSVPMAQIPRIERLMTIGVYSPIDFLLTTPSGQKIGRNLPGVDEINEVPLAFYSGVENNNEYATLLNPEAGEYVMEIFGTADGAYKIGVDISSDIYSESLDNYMNGVIQNEQSKIYIIELKYDSNNNPQIKIIEQNDSIDYFKRWQVLCSSNEISKRAVCRYLKVKYRFLEKKFKFYNKIDKPRLKQIIKRSIKRSIKRLERKIKFFYKKKWMTNHAYETLMDDLKEIRMKL